MFRDGRQEAARLDLREARRRQPLEPGEYTAALTLNYAVDDGTGVSQLEPLVIENVKFTVSE